MGEADRGASRVGNLLKLGCMGLVGLIILVVVALLAMGWVQLRGAQWESTDTSVELPALPDPGSTDAALTSVVATRVLIDVKDADVEILPVPAGRPMRIEATYDARHYKLEHRPAPGGEDQPGTHIWFRRGGSGGAAMHWVRQLLGEKRAEIRIELPSDIPLELHLNTSGGLTRAEIGGLTVHEFIAELSTGALSVDISEPSASMERFEIDSRQATITVRKLGNASPRSIELDLIMGGGEFDFSGAWRRDAEISIETQMSGGTLTLPEEVNVQGLENWLTLSRSQETPRPTLRFEVESSVGQLTVEPSR
jgi:hypothetical protein